MLLSDGDVIAGRFRVVRMLAQGGMGAVYAAEQLGTGKLRALKVMLPAIVHDARQRQRFVQEARVGARIASEHVVEVVDAGVDDDTAMPFIAMELLEGEDLAELVLRRGSLPFDEVVELLAQASHALKLAHAIGIVHRDIKPENLFLAVSPRHRGGRIVKVLDFGIAKIVTQSLHRPTGLLGTPLFMAPEQLRPGLGVTPAADVWALGLVAFYLLTAHHYWHAADEGGGLVELLDELRAGSRQQASARARVLLGAGAPSWPPGFDDWFSRCLEQTPAARYADAGSAVAALESLGQAAAPTELALAPAAATVPQTVVGSPRSGAAAIPARPAPVGPILGLTAAVALVAGVASFMSTRSDSTFETTAAKVGGPRPDDRQRVEPVPLLPEAAATVALAPPSPDDSSAAGAKDIAAAPPASSLSRPAASHAGGGATATHTPPGQPRPGAPPPTRPQRSRNQALDGYCGVAYPSAPRGYVYDSGAPRDARVQAARAMGCQGGSLAGINFCCP